MRSGWTSRGYRADAPALDRSFIETREQMRNSPAGARSRRCAEVMPLMNDLAESGIGEAVNFGEDGLRGQLRDLPRRTGLPQKERREFSVRIICVWRL